MLGTLVAAAVFCGGDGPGSDTTGPTNNPQRPAAPSNLQVVATSSTSAQLTWTDNSNNEQGFEVYRSASASDKGTRVTTVGANTETWDDNSLAPASSYFYRVYSYNGDGPSSSYANGSVTTPSPEGPSIALSRTSVSFNATEGGGNPAAEAVNVTNGASGTLSGLTANVTYGSGQTTGWLAASLSGTTAPAVLTLGSTTGSLGAGTYTATVSVTSGVASNSPQSINVTFTVTGQPPQIALSRTNVSVTAIEGGANPAAETVVVTNSGGGTLSGLARSIAYGSGQTTGWLTATLSSTTAPSTLTLQAATGSLSAGTYTATVSVTSNVAGNSPQTVSVTFTVGGQAPAIALSPTSVSFSANEGGVDPSDEIVDVTNAGGGTLSGLAASVSYGTGQASGWLTASLSTTTAPTALILGATTSGLSAGTYTATVSVSSGVAANSPQTVAVTFVVAALPVGPDLAAAAVSGSDITLTWTYTWPQFASNVDAYLLEESTTSASTGFTLIQTYTGVYGQSPYSVTLNRSPGTYYYRVRARTGLWTTAYSQVRSATVSAQTRQLRIINNATSGLFLANVAQVKVIPPNGTFTASNDLLAADNLCYALPGDYLSPGESQTFDITVGDDYWVLIGMGRWELDLTDLVCPNNSYPWWKRRWFTDVNWNNWYVWVAVTVTQHTSGTWDWTVSGSYLNGTLVVTPSGNQSIPFQVTASDPIP